MQQIPGDFHILSAVLGDQVYFPFLVPLQGLQAIGAFTCSEGMPGQPVEAEAVAEMRTHFLEKIEGRQAVEVTGTVTAQHPVIESPGIEADHQIELLQVGDQAVHFVFEVGDTILQL